MIVLLFYMKLKLFLLFGLIVCLMSISQVSALTTFGSNLINTTGNLSVDFGTLFVDSNLNMVGIGTYNPKQPLNVIGDGNFTGNMTFGQKITFAFGEIIDNIVNGWIRITGGLNVTQNLTVDGGTLLVDSVSNEVIMDGTLNLKEQAEANTNTVGYGQIWVDTATPNTLFFTDDADTDFQIGGLKTSYLNIPSAAFHGASPDVDDVSYGNDGGFSVNAGVTDAKAAVILPHGAIVTACIVYGSNTALNWFLVRSNDHDAAGSNMATTVINTEDTSISNATIDNQNYQYNIWINNLDSLIYSARITYTTN